MANYTEAEIQTRTFVSSTPKPMMFVHLLEPKAPTLLRGTAKPVYSFTYVVDPADPDLKELYTKALTVVKSEFASHYAAAVAKHKADPKPDVAADLIRLLSAEVKFPFTDGNDQVAARAAEGKHDGEWARGKVLIKCATSDATASGKQPTLGSVESGSGVVYDGPAVEVNKAKFYPGAEVFVQLWIGAFEVDGKRYVKIYPQKVFVTGKGQRLGGTGGAEVFDKYVGKVSSVNPLDDPLTA